MNEQSGGPDLRVLAHQAMIDRGLEPDFPPAAIQQLNSIQGPARANELAERDLRLPPVASPPSSLAPRPSRSPLN